MSIFENATKSRFRFPSNNGELTTEQLWDLPLNSDTKSSLNSVAKAIAKEIRENDDEDFVCVKSNKTEILDQHLEVVKHIISVRLAEKANREYEKATKEKREKLLSALSEIEDNALKSKTADEIRAELDALN